jgi:anti-anti-sigma factor
MALSEPSSATVDPRDKLALAGLAGDRIVLWIRGEHDGSTIVALSETIARAITVDEGDLVLDLSEVQFMGSAAVGVIIRTREFLRLHSRTLVLQSPSSAARRVLDVCGVTDLAAPR